VALKSYLGKKGNVGVEKQIHVLRDSNQRSLRCIEV
jgi:hypothetical protein